MNPTDTPANYHFEPVDKTKCVEVTVTGTDQNGNEVREVIWVGPPLEEPTAGRLALHQAPLETGELVVTPPIHLRLLELLAESRPKEDRLARELSPKGVADLLAARIPPSPAPISKQ